MIYDNVQISAAIWPPSSAKFAHRHSKNYSPCSNLKVMSTPTAYSPAHQ